MQQTQHAPRSSRGQLMRNTALALALVTGIGATAALTNNPAPAFAQGGVVGSQTLTPTTFSALAEKVVPAVVAVRVEGGGQGMDSGQMFPPNSPFQDFFDRFLEERNGQFRFDRRGAERGDESRPNRRVRPKLSQGSGFVVSADGYVVTNNHVVEDATTVTIVTNEGDEYEADVVGTDSRTDLAVLKIRANVDLPHVSFTDQETKVGDWVMAVGNPFGLGGTVTTGIVSARGRHLGTGPYDDFIQIDAAVNRGNSGGPTFDLNGDVIGVNTAIYSPNGGSVGIGFAIPASIASRVVDQLMEDGQITRGWLGVSIQTVTPDIAQSVGLDKPMGAIIAEVFAGAPAEGAGLEPGDVVLKVNGNDVETSRDLALLIADIEPGKSATLAIQRDRREQEITVEIGAMPKNPRLAGLEDAKPRSAEEATPDRLADLGLEVAPASEVDNDSEARGVVVTEVAGDSEAADKGISPGDRILRVAGVEVNTPAELGNALDGAREDGLSSVLVLVRSSGGQRFVTLELTKA